MKIVDNIEVSGVRKVVINNSEYVKQLTQPKFYRYHRNGDAEYLTPSCMASRIRKLINTGKWRLWIHGDTINLVMKDA